MVEISNSKMGSVRTFPPLPPLATPNEILADALPVLDPPNQMSVTDAAERYMRVQTQGAWQNFDRTVTPYMVEPSDITQSRRYKAVAFAGPSQSGKTMMLQSVSLHSVTCNQQPVFIVHMSRSERDKWVEEKLDPIIGNSPDISDRLGKGRDDSTFSRKRFMGMRLSIGYPTPRTLSGGSYGMVLLTDLDHQPLILGGKNNPEGSPFKMARARIKTYMSRGCVLVEGSPAYPVIDLGWRVKKSAPHEMPPVTGGIIQIYNDGTRGRLYWECLDCSQEYEPRFDRLKYNAKLSPGEAGAGAEMQCPHCGSLLAHRHKVELNRNILRDRGGWRHEGRNGSVVAMGDSSIRYSDIASYALNGAAATFASWQELVFSYETARHRAEDIGDETDLATVNYTEIGLPHRSLRASDEDELNLEFLKENGHDCEKGIAPSWARFITISVDVQGTYFPVQVVAWGEGKRSQVVDRFDLTQPPASAPNAVRDGDGNSRALDPAKHLEDWDVLNGLLDRVWPVEGAEFGLCAVAASVDFQGKAGVSDNAEDFWKQRRDAGQGQRWFVSRGHGGWKHGSRVWHESPERRSGGGKARSTKILNFAADRLKDTISKALAKANSGVGSLLVPLWMSDAHLGEFIAERRLSKGWEKKAGQVRNEGFDLSVMARSVAEKLGLLLLNFDNAPDWALSGAANIFAVMLHGESEEHAIVSAPKPAASKRNKRVHQMNYLRRK